VSPPLLRFRGARIDRLDGPWVDRLHGDGGTTRLVLAGYYQPLLALLSGGATLAAGSVEIAGQDARTALVRGRVGLALAEANAPRDWAVKDYLSQSAELLGLSPKIARKVALAALEELGLAAIANRRIALLDMASRRSAWIAHATLGRPAAVVIETPFDGLDDAQADHVFRTLEAASAGRRLIVTTEVLTHTGPNRRLADTADCVMVTTLDGLVFVGSPAEALAPVRHYLVTSLRHAAALRGNLESKGIRVGALGEATGGGEVDGARLIVTLPSPDTRPIVEAAVSADAPLAELLPLTISTREASEDA
jgi:putative ABC transport system ATP-binding protein